jgi:hypothetical protein
MILKAFDLPLQNPRRVYRYTKVFIDYASAKETILCCCQRFLYARNIHFMVLDTPPNFHSRIMRTILIASLGAPFPHSRADTKAAYTKASRVFRKPKPTWKRITSLIALSTRTSRKLAQRRCQAIVLSTLWRMAEKREYIKSFSRFSPSLMTCVVVM